MGTFSFMTPLRSNENHRQAKQFKKVIYVGLSEWSDDLRLIGDDVEEDIEDSSEATTGSDATPNGSDGDVKVDLIVFIGSC